MSEQLLRVGDVARRCQLSVGEVYAAIKEGRLKAARLGSRKALRIELKDMEQWIKNSKNITIQNNQTNNLVI